MVHLGWLMVLDTLMILQAEKWRKQGGSEQLWYLILRFPIKAIAQFRNV